MDITTNPPPEVYQRGHGWGLFDSDEYGKRIERCDDLCSDEGDPTTYMTDEAAEWLVLLLAEAEDDIDADYALAQIVYSNITGERRRD